MGIALDYHILGNEQVMEQRHSPQSPLQIPFQIQTLPLASQATAGQCQEGSLSPPQILYTFCKTLNTQLLEERPRALNVVG